MYCILLSHPKSSTKCCQTKPNTTGGKNLSSLPIFHMNTPWGHSYRQVKKGDQSKSSRGKLNQLGTLNLILCSSSSNDRQYFPLCCTAVSQLTIWPLLFHFLISILLLLPLKQFVYLPCNSSHTHSEDYPLQKEFWGGQ